MMTVDLILSIHDVLLKRYGGASGGKDMHNLQSAVARPYHTFDGVDLYVDIVDKAAALIESLIINHPFVDGNKRTGYVAMRLLLLAENKDIKATEEEKYAFVIGIASGELKYEAILTWLKDKLFTLPAIQSPAQ